MTKINYWIIIAFLCILSNSVRAQYNFSWIDTSNIKYVGNTLLVRDTSLYARANSDVHLPILEDGWAEMVIGKNFQPELTFSLTASSGATYGLHDYAYFFTGNEVYVYAKGELKGSFGNYKIGDRFRISRTGGTITFSKNRGLFLTSLATNPLKLLFVSVILARESQVNTIITSPSFVRNQTLFWDKLQGLYVNGNKYSNTNGYQQYGHSGCISKNYLPVNDSGYFCFSPTQSNLFAFGFLTDPRNYSNDYAQMQFSILFKSGNVYMYKYGNIFCDCGQFEIGDVFAFEVSDNVIMIYKNGIKLSSLEVDHNDKLYIAFSMYMNSELEIKTFCSPDFLLNHEVSWKDTLGVEFNAIENSITKIDSSITIGDTINSFCFSNNYLPISKDGEFEFTPEDLGDLFIGFTDEMIGSTLATVYCGLYLKASGELSLMKEGNEITSIGTYNPGDRIKLRFEDIYLNIEINDDQIYRFDEIEKHQSKKLYQVCCFFNSGAKIKNFNTTFVDRFKAKEFIKDPTKPTRSGVFGFRFSGGAPPYNYSIQNSLPSHEHDNALPPGVYSVLCYDSDGDTLEKKIYIGTRLNWNTTSSITQTLDSTSLFKQGANSWSGSYLKSTNKLIFSEAINWLEFTVENPSVNYFIGLGEIYDTATVEPSSYCIQIENGQAYILEIHPDGLANKTASGIVSPDDIFHIEQNSKGIVYFKNNEIIYSTPYYFPKTTAALQVGIYSNNTTISNIRSNASKN